MLESADLSLYCQQPYSPRQICWRVFLLGHLKAIKNPLEYFLIVLNVSVDRRTVAWLTYYKRDRNECKHHKFLTPNI